MYQMYIGNAFALQMIPAVAIIGQEAIPIERVKYMLKEREVISCVGHADTARLYSDLLGMEIPANRISISLEETDELIVGLYKGPRLPEGTTQLPEGATIEWRWVYFINPEELRKS